MPLKPIFRLGPANSMMLLLFDEIPSGKANMDPLCWGLRHQTAASCI